MGECSFCGSDKTYGQPCPICGKEVFTSIKEISGGYSEMAPVKYQGCPFCGSFLVKEIVGHNEGLHVFLFNVEHKIAPSQQDWAALSDPRIVDVVCGSCGFSLTREDKRAFFEETEGWIED